MESSGVTDKDFNRVIDVMTSKENSFRDKIKAVSICNYIILLFYTILIVYVV